MTDPTTVDTIPWGDPPAERLETSTPRKCKHPRDRRIRVRVVERPDVENAPMLPGQAVPGSERVECGKCGHVFDEAKRKLGRSSRARGQKLENAANDELGLQRRGRFGGPEDGGGAADPAVAQSKTGPTWFVARFALELDKLAVPALGRPRILVTTEKPGPGRRARRLVTLYSDEFLALVGRLDSANAEAVSEVIDSTLPGSDVL